MIHYHGLPITPDTTPAIALAGAHAFVSFRHPDQLGLAAEICQSFAVDNGAFSAWKAGSPVTDWEPYYEWVESISRTPNFDWAIIPDVIDGTEEDNDRLLYQWPMMLPGVPVWHLHESIARLVGLCDRWPRVALGSSGQYAQVGSQPWEQRMQEAMKAICVNGQPIAKIHGLRMLDPEIFSRYPFASADSTNIGRNVNLDSHWNGTYTPPTKAARAAVMRARIESVNGALYWEPHPQEVLL